MLYPNTDILYYTAIGDAYCLATEYIKSPRDDSLKARALKFEDYLQHPVHKCRPGTFSDDTQQSAANIKVLLSDDWSPLSFANAWVSEFKTDPRDAYSRRFQKYLEQVKDGKEFLETIDPVSNKNGAAMRSAPLGVLSDPKDVLTIATLQAQITHNTPGGLFGSQAVALMSHYALHVDLPLERGNLKNWLIDQFNSPLSNYSEKELKSFLAKPWRGPVTGPEVGLNTALSVFELLVSCRSLLDVIRKTIEFGGDTDSVAAIALGIASCRKPDDLPAFMHNKLEVGTKFGPQYLKDLGEKLMIKFNK